MDAMTTSGFAPDTQVPCIVQLVPERTIHVRMLLSDRNIAGGASHYSLCRH